MSTIKVIAGDLDSVKWSFGSAFGASMYAPSTKAHLFKGERIDLDQELERVELHTEESVKKLGGTAGWGLAGAALLGPLGAIGGMLLGGRGKSVLFAGYLKDGRKFLATTDAKTWQKLSAITF